MSEQNELRVIHALRLKSFADTPVVAEHAGLDVDSTKVALDKLAEGEYVRYREGAMTGWMLMPTGRAHGETLLAGELDASGKRSELEALYAKFLELNKPFLALCTNWQVRDIDGEQVMNDHDDADYDAEVIGRLATTDAEMQPICSDLAGVLDRFGHYGPGFSKALANLQSGESDWFTSPRLASYHTVWHELHEDLLASLGIDRAKEGHT